MQEPIAKRVELGVQDRVLTLDMRRSCRATPPPMKKSRIEVDAPAQRSLISCACEPDHETDPGKRRNHPLLRWREEASHQQHAEEILCFCLSKPGHPNELEAARAQEH